MSPHTTVRLHYAILDQSNCCMSTSSLTFTGLPIKVNLMLMVYLHQPISIRNTGRTYQGPCVLFSFSLSHKKSKNRQLAQSHLTSPPPSRRSVAARPSQHSWTQKQTHSPREGTALVTAALKTCKLIAPQTAFSRWLRSTFPHLTICIKVT